MMMFWVLVPCRHVSRCQNFRETYSIFRAEADESTWRQNLEEHHHYPHCCENLKFDYLGLTGVKDFFLASASTPALGPTQPPIQWVLGVVSAGVKHSWGMMLTTHPHLVPRSRMSRSYTSSPPECLHGM
jgi:hypothetical protein